MTTFDREDQARARERERESVRERERETKASLAHEAARPGARESGPHSRPEARARCTTTSLSLLSPPTPWARYSLAGPPLPTTDPPCAIGRHSGPEAENEREKNRDVANQYACAYHLFQVRVETRRRGMNRRNARVRYSVHDDASVDMSIRIWAHAPRVICCACALFQICRFAVSICFLVYTFGFFLFFRLRSRDIQQMLLRVMGRVCEGASRNRFAYKRGERSSGGIESWRCGTQVFVYEGILFVSIFCFCKCFQELRNSVLFFDTLPVGKMFPRQRQ